MDLERGERLIEARALLSPLMLMSLVFAVLLVLGVVAHGLTPLTLLGATPLLLLALAAAVWEARHVKITDRRIVEYRVLLARLARRFPRVAPLEARTRRTTVLARVTAARKSDNRVILNLADGTLRALDCHDEPEARQLLLVIQEQLRRAPWLQELQLGPAVTVTRRAAQDGRCPYCHDALTADDDAVVVACERCGAAQHEECLEVHGGCAAFGCNRPARARARA